MSGFSTGALAAALCLAALATATPARAAPPAGHSVTRAQSASIQRGMAQAEVRERLGPPAKVLQFPTRAGQTWVYTVLGSADPRTLEIDFTPIGMVSAVTERVVESN